MYKTITSTPKPRRDGTLLFLALFLIFSHSSCKNNQPTTDGENVDSSLVYITGAQFSQTNMQTGTMQEVDFVDVVEVRGIADVPPQSKATVSPVISGSVKAIFVSPGDRVQKGQPLLSFEGPEIIALQQSYVEVSLQLKSLEAEYKRQKALFAENISSEKSFLEAESNYKRAVANCEGLKQQLLLLNINVEKVEQAVISSSAVIYAPIAGDIIKMNADISKYIQPSDVVIEMIDTHQLQLYLSVFERNITDIRRGQKVIFSSPEGLQQPLTATITTVGKAIDRTDRTATVQALPTPEAQEALLSGMYIEAKIVLNTQKVWALPVDALIAEDDEYFGLLLQSANNNEYIFRKVKLQTGKRNGDYMEIIPHEGFNQSSIMLIKGVYQAL